MKTRIITATVGIVIVVVALILGEQFPLIINILMSLISCLMCYEFLSAKKLEKDIKYLIPCLFLGLTSPLLCNTSFNYLPITLFILTFVSIFVFCYKKIEINNFFFALSGILLISIFMSIFNYYLCFENKYISFKCVLVLAIPWLADSGAYFIGNAFGKRKLCPEISPNKTIEGAIGGIISGLVSSIIIGLVFLLIYNDFHPNFFILAVIGIVNTATSIIGDLFFSIIKRSCEIKDYGTIMPGHGGILDRFDSVIFCIPFTVFMYQFMFI